LPTQIFKKIQAQGNFSPSYKKHSIFDEILNLVFIDSFHDRFKNEMQFALETLLFRESNNSKYYFGRTVHMKWTFSSLTTCPKNNNDWVHLTVVIEHCQF